MNGYTIGGLCRVNKIQAERLYYSNMGVYLLNAKMSPNNLYQKPTLSKIGNTDVDFDKLLNNFEYYNGKAWYWAEKTTVTYMAKRNYEYKQLKTIGQVYRYFGVDLKKEPDYFGKNGISNEIAVTNVIFDYIVKYRLMELHPADKVKHINYILDFLEKFGMEGYKYDEQKKMLLIKILKYVGFEL